MLGTNAAMADAAAVVTSTKASTGRIAGLDSEEQARQDTTRQKTGGKPKRDAASRKRGDAAGNHSNDVISGRSYSDPNSNFAFPHRYRMAG